MSDFPEDEFTTRACQEIAEAPSLEVLDRLVARETLALVGPIPLAYGLGRLRRVASTARARQAEIYDQRAAWRAAFVEHRAARGGAR